MTTRDEHIWDEEVVEIFLDVDGSGVNYAELEISPANVVCDLRVERPAPSVKSLTEWDWTGMVERSSRCATRTEATRAGRRWRACRGTASRRSRQRPRRERRQSRGDSWRFNVFRIKRPGRPESAERGGRGLRRVVGARRAKFPRAREIPPVQVRLGRSRA